MREEGRGKGEYEGRGKRKREENESVRKGIVTCLSSNDFRNHDHDTILKNNFSCIFAYILSLRKVIKQFLLIIPYVLVP